MIKSNSNLIRSAIIAQIAVLLFLGNALNAQECGVIHCSTSGLSTSAGTKADPVDFITGLSMVNANNSRLHLQLGTYVISNALVMPSNTSIVGGFDMNFELLT